MRKTPASLKDSAKSVQKGIFAASNIGTSIAMVLLVVLVLLTVADVVMRRFFNAPIGGTFELTQVLLGIIVFFSFSYCAIKGGHIVLDVLVTRFPIGCNQALELSSILIRGDNVYNKLAFVRPCR